MDVVVVFEVLSVEIKFTGRRFSLSLRRECVYTCLAVYKTYTTKVFLQMLRIDGAQSLLLPPKHTSNMVRYSTEQSVSKQQNIERKIKQKTQIM